MHMQLADFQFIGINSAVYIADIESFHHFNDHSIEVVVIVR